MNNIKKITALILSLCIMVFAFSGCGDAPLSPAPTPNTQTSALDDDTLIVTIDGFPVYWAEFRYWLNYSLQYCGFTPGSEIDWNSEYTANKTLAEYIMDDAVNAVALYKVIDKNAAAMNLPLSAEDKANIETIMAENRSYFETDDEYEAYLSESYLTEELMQYLLEASCNYYNIFVKMFGANGELVPDTDALAFGAENNYYRAKHILMAFEDDAGNTYSEAEMQTKYAQLEDMLAQIRAAENPNELFDQFMAEYSEDPGLAAYPSGYQFVKGDMVSEFQTAVEALNDYEVSDIVTMGDFGYTIIMRLPLDPDDVSISDMYGYTLRYNTANFEFETLANTWTLEANIEYAEAYSRINLDDLF